MISGLCNSSSVLSTAAVNFSGNTQTCTVTGKSVDTTVVAAVSEDGGFTGRYTIKVIDKKKVETEKEDPGLAVEITVNDMKIVPAKKTINKGQSFSIKAGLQEDAFEESLSREEMDEMLKESIDSVSYRSTDSSVASVGKKTGRQPERKKEKRS